MVHARFFVGLDIGIGTLMWGEGGSRDKLLKWRGGLIGHSELLHACFFIGLNTSVGVLNEGRAALKSEEAERLIAQNWFVLVSSSELALGFVC